MDYSYIDEFATAIAAYNICLKANHVTEQDSKNYEKSKRMYGARLVTKSSDDLIQSLLIINTKINLLLQQVSINDMKYTELKKKEKSSTYEQRHSIAMQLEDLTTKNSNLLNLVYAYRDISTNIADKIAIERQVRT